MSVREITDIALKMGGENPQDVTPAQRSRFVTFFMQPKGDAEVSLLSETAIPFVIKNVLMQPHHPHRDVVIKGLGHLMKGKRSHPVSKSVILPALAVSLTKPMSEKKMAEITTFFKNASLSAGGDFLLGKNGLADTINALAQADIKVSAVCRHQIDRFLEKFGNIKKIRKWPFGKKNIIKVIDGRGHQWIQDYADGKKEMTKEEARDYLAKMLLKTQHLEVKDITPQDPNIDQGFHIARVIPISSNASTNMAVKKHLGNTGKV